MDKQTLNASAKTKGGHLAARISLVLSVLFFLAAVGLHATISDLSDKAMALEMLSAAVRVLFLISINMILAGYAIGKGSKGSIAAWMSIVLSVFSWIILAATVKAFTEFAAGLLAW